MNNLKVKLYHYVVFDTVSIDKKASLKGVTKTFEFDIGIEGKKGSDRFALDVCDFLGIKTYYDEYIRIYGFISFDHLLIVENYNEEKVLNCIKSRIENVTGKNWEDIARKLAVFLYYEFNPNIGNWEGVISV